MKQIYKINIVIGLVLAIILFLYRPFHNQLIPQGFAPVDVVYHGSPNNNIKTFEPRNTHTRDQNEGPVVFATPSIKLASCYLFRWDDSWVNQSISCKDDNNANCQVVMVISDKARFKREDLGGAIYILPVQGFYFIENKGLGIYEWINKNAVNPMLQINFASGLEAMQKLGILVYFVEPNQFQHYLSLSWEEQERFLSRLKRSYE